MIAVAFVAVVLSAAPSGDAVAKVDGATVTASELERRLEEAGAASTPEALLVSIIDERLLSAEGHRRKLERSPVATDYLAREQRAEAGKVFLEKEIANRAAPDDALLRRMFHSTADFAAFDQLAFATEDQARAAIARIKKGGTFEAEARGAVTSRIASSAEKAQLQMRAEIPPALAEALFAAEPRGIVGPAALGEGVAVARLLKKVVGTEAEFGARREAIATHAKKQLAEQAKQHVVGQLRVRDHATLDEAFLRSAEDVEPTQEQLEHVVATIGGTKIRYRDIFDTVRAIRANGGHMGPSLRISVGWKEIDAQLLQKVAVERGFLNAPEVLAARPRHEEAAVGYAAMMQIMNAAPPPTKDDIARFYERNAAAFRRPLAEVLPQATAGAAREKREAAYAQAIGALRGKATVSVDRDALARVARKRG